MAFTMQNMKITLWGKRTSNRGWGLQCSPLLWLQAFRYINICAFIHILMNVKIFKALGNSARLKIIQTLLVKEHNVTDLTSIIKKDQTTVSRHLLTLTNANIIKSKRNGRNIFYSIFNNQMKEWLLRILVSQTKSKKENVLRNKIEHYIMKQEKHG